MPIEGYDQAKCQQRNRLAARRDQVEAAPFTFLRDPAAAAQRADLRYAHGTLPATDEAALARINALLPPDKARLTADQVYIHYLEAANNAYIGERDMRPMFLGDTTLRNIAADSSTGIAFMNSHRTGGLSHPADLPMGKTFAGRYEEYQDGTQRAVVGIYLIRGVHPNGANGPSTDDLHAAISGGTQADVSVGLGPGEKICDVCGEGVNASREEEDADGTRRQVPACPHVPGTTRKMTKDQVAAQQARGVRTGAATYTLHHAHCGEISAVYDGAVPGAGFAKALRFAADLTPTERHQARAAYATLLKRGDFPMDDITDLVADGFERAMVRLGLRPAPLPDEGDAPAPAGDPALPPATLVDSLTILPPFDVTQTPEYQAQATELARLRAQRVAEAATFAADQATALVLDHRLYPTQRAELLALAADLTADDLAHPLAAGTRLTRLTALLGAGPQHTLTQEHVGSLHILPPVQLSGTAETQATAFQDGYEQGRSYGAQGTAKSA